MIEYIVPAVVFVGVLLTLAKVFVPQLMDTSNQSFRRGEPDPDAFAAANARMEQRIATIERIMTADNPNWRN